VGGSRNDAVPWLVCRQAVSKHRAKRTDKQRGLRLLTFLYRMTRRYGSGSPSVFIVLHGCETWVVLIRGGCLKTGLER
jgi:hypothetical protein